MNDTSIILNRINRQLRFTETLFNITSKRERERERERERALPLLCKPVHFEHKHHMQ